jgi:hypothetical protein
MIVQTGSEIDRDALEEAYGRLLDAARGAGFRAPRAPDEWPAERVLAHVAVNDRLLAATVVEVLHGRTPAYDNRAATRPEYLDALVREAGSWAGLVEEVGRAARVLLALAARLADGAGTVVHARIQDAREVALDADVPVARLFRARSASTCRGTPSNCWHCGWGPEVAAQGSPANESALEPIRRSITVRRSAEDAFRIFTERVVDWWPIRTHSIAATHRAAEGVEVVGVVMEPGVGGRFYERMSDGREGYWARWPSGIRPATSSSTGRSIPRDRARARWTSAHGGGAGRDARGPGAPRVGGARRRGTRGPRGVRRARRLVHGAADVRPVRRVGRRVALEGFVATSHEQVAIRDRATGRRLIRTAGSRSFPSGPRSRGRDRTASRSTATERGSTGRSAGSAGA